jgi:hypothetical protein
MISCARATLGLGRPSPGLMARLGVPVGGRVRKSRAVGDQSSPTSREKVEGLWPLDARNGDHTRRLAKCLTHHVLNFAYRRHLEWFLTPFSVSN